VVSPFGVGIGSFASRTAASGVVLGVAAVGLASMAASTQVAKSTRHTK
jgi:hypothetical protein